MSRPAPRALIACVALAITMHGCTSASNGGGSSSTSTETPLVAGTVQPLTRLLSASTSGFTEPAELVLRDRAALESAWRTLHDGLPGNPAPSIDFASRMVVLVALGPRNTGGHAIRADSVVVDGGAATVHYTATSPAPSCMTAQVITSPVDVISVTGLDGPVRFERRNVVQQC